MGLRADVIHELKTLDTAPRALRKFGLSVGTVFALIAGLGFWKQWSQIVVGPMGTLAVGLIFFGTASPASLKFVHRIWMTFALALGWCMSRLILTLLFFFAVVPIAFLGRMLGLPFIKMRRAPQQSSYWVDHPSRSARHHTDMF